MPAKAHPSHSSFPANATGLATGVGVIALQVSATFLAPIVPGLGPKKLNYQVFNGCATEQGVVEYLEDVRSHNRGAAIARSTMAATGVGVIALTTLPILLKVAMGIAAAVYAYKTYTHMRNNKEINGLIRDHKR